MKRCCEILDWYIWGCVLVGRFWIPTFENQIIKLNPPSALPAARRKSWSGGGTTKLEASGLCLSLVMEQAPENGAGVSAAPEARTAPRYAAPDQKTISRAFSLDPPAFHLTRLDAPTAPKLVIKIANELLWWAGILACNFCWACCCCRNLQTEVRAILMLTTVETCAAVAYAINLLVTALGTDAEVETSVYYIALMLIVLSFMLWVFVLSSIRFVAPPPPHSPSHRALCPLPPPQDLAATIGQRRAHA